ncbi:hypothetical protein GCM10011335_45120 [Aureimonas glaciei]|uniref:Uncharacterized protein n=1 Tax=Aureimonas glaciei TaxID=1776957 RepID=A0A917DGV7_9HYPH|nr:hypothetical protein GCM10011335_45120 [Aureimonas glaciei]
MRGPLADEGALTDMPPYMSLQLEDAQGGAQRLAAAPQPLGKHALWLQLLLGAVSAFDQVSAKTR